MTRQRQRKLLWWDTNAIIDDCDTSDATGFEANFN
jgi:hypothetical protein